MTGRWGWQSRLFIKRLVSGFAPDERANWRAEYKALWVKCVLSGISANIGIQVCSREGEPASVFTLLRLLSLPSEQIVASTGHRGGGKQAVRGCGNPAPACGGAHVQRSPRAAALRGCVCWPWLRTGFPGCHLCVTAGATLLRAEVWRCPGAASCPGARGGRWGSPGAWPGARRGCGGAACCIVPANKGQTASRGCSAREEGGQAGASALLEVAQWVLLPRLPLFIPNCTAQPRPSWPRGCAPAPIPAHTTSTADTVPSGVPTALCRAALELGLKQNTF